MSTMIIAVLALYIFAALSAVLFVIVVANYEWRKCVKEGNEMAKDEVVAATKYRDVVLVFTKSGAVYRVSALHGKYYNSSSDFQLTSDLMLTLDLDWLST